MSTRIIEVEPGTRIRYSYDDLIEGTEDQTERVTVEGVKGREVGMQRLGNQGFIIETRDGRDVAISRYAFVDVEGVDYEATETLNLWTLTRLGGRGYHGEMREVIVAAETVLDARWYAAKAAGTEGDEAWHNGNEFQLRVLHLGVAEPHVEAGIVLADVLEG